MTNEQQNADQFEAFLCGEISLADDDAQFARQLMELGQRTLPAESFMAELEAWLADESPGAYSYNHNHNHNHTYLRRGLGAVAALALVLFGFLITPAGRGLAQAAWAFFTRSDSDQGITTVFLPSEHPDSAAAVPTLEPTVAAPTLEPTVATPTPELTVEALDEGRPVVYAENGATIPAAFEPTNTSERPDYAVYLPKVIPEGYQVDRVEFHSFNPMTVVEYVCESNTAFFLTQIAIGVQSYLDDPAYQREVGASAEIVDVDVMGVIGQYVRGDWTLVEVVDREDIPEGGTLDVETVWDNEMEYHHLSWYADGMLFRIYTSRVSAIEAPECALEMSDFIAFAEQLTPVE